MRAILIAVMFLSLLSAAKAEPIAVPIYTINDSWSYHLTVQSGNNVKESDITISINRVGSDGMLVTQKSADNARIIQSTLFGLDWSKRRSVNGKETTVLQPFAFPLDVGKTWRIAYTETNPTPQKMNETDELPFKVTGWEDVTVPAGQFHALKIESNGRWTADLKPRLLNSALVARQGNVAAQTSENRIVQSVRVSGRYYKCFWYVPEVKRWVKSTEESYSSDGTLGQVVSDELQSYQVAGTKKPDSTPAPPPAATTPAPAPSPVPPPAAPSKSAI